MFSLFACGKVPSRTLWLLILLSVGVLTGCAGEGASSAIEPPPERQDAAGGKGATRSSTAVESRKPDEHTADVMPSFVDRAQAAGIDFTFFTDAVPDRYFLPEIMGGGVAWIDFDNDGWLDLYAVDGCELKAPDPRQTTYVNRLYRNRADGTFAEIGSFSGAADSHYGQAVGAGDYDADGFADVYLANYGPNALLRNNGDGTFSDVTGPSGTADELWGAGALWFDADGDGLLDLYVVNYMDVTFDNHQHCTFNGTPGYCGPGHYNAVPDLLFLNRGDGAFVESSAELGLTVENGKGLSAVAVDLDEDLKPELYVANDMTPNFLFTRSVVPHADRSSARPYVDVAATAGCALSDNGQHEASMGIACADFDGDGAFDIFLTHFYAQKNTLYRNLGNLMFVDDSRRSRIAATSFEFLGFGTVPLDYDYNGAPDLFISNGHVLGPLHQPNEMPPQLLRNDGMGRFDDVSNSAGAYFRELLLGRGVGAADYDNDGDLDIAVTHLDRPLALLRNETETGRQFLGLELSTPDRLPPVGGRVVLAAGGRRQVRPIAAGGSYLSSGDLRLLFGLGEADRADLIEIYWPSGRVDRFEGIEGNRYWRILEGEVLEPLLLSN